MSSIERFHCNTVIITVLCSCNSSIAVVQVFFTQQSYNITEGGAVNITLVTSTTDYEFDFNVTLLSTDTSFTGESCSVTLM